MLSLVYSLLVSTRTPHRPHPNHRLPTTQPPVTRLATSFSLSDLYTAADPPRPSGKRAKTRSQMGTFFYQSSLKSVRHGGSSAQKASSRPECLRVNISAFELALHAVRARLSGASTLLVPDARPESAARLDRFPSPRPHPRAWPSHRRPPHRCAALFFASFKENVHVMYSADAA